MNPSYGFSSNEGGPSALSLFLTGRCNLNCHYCFVNKTNLDHTTANEECLRKSIDVLFSYPGKTKNISFKGGEPLIAFPLIKRIYDYARQEADKKHIILNGAIVTNGTLLKQEMIDYFIRSRISVAISIDGTKASHDRNRPFKGSSDESSFNKIISIIEKMKFGPLKLTASMVFTPSDIEFLIENVRFLNGKGFFCVEFYPDLYARWMLKDFDVIEKVFRDFATYYIDLFNGEEKIFKNHGIDAVVNGCGESTMDRCAELHLSPEGEYYVCDKVFSLTSEDRKRYVVGDAENGVNEQKRREMLQWLREDFASDSKLECLGCEYRSYCFCPIGHHIYASTQKAKGHGGAAQDFYQAFCRFSRIYSQTFLRIQSALRYNLRFIELYQFVVSAR